MEMTVLVPGTAAAIIMGVIEPGAAGLLVEHRLRGTGLERRECVAKQVAHGVTALLRKRLEHLEQIARRGTHRREPAPRQRRKIVERRADDRRGYGSAAPAAHCRGPVLALHFRKPSRPLHFMTPFRPL